MRGLGRVVLAQSLLLASIFAGQLITPGPDDVLTPDEVVIRLKPNGVIANVLAGFNNTVTVTGSQSALNLYLLKVPAAVRDVILQQLANLDAVEYAEPNRIRSTSAISPDDASYAVQWWLTKMQAESAWGLFPGRFRTASSTGTRVRVAILDTGADCTHPDFINTGGSSTDIGGGGQFNWSLSQALVPTTVASPACPWQDDHGHGTHVAGIVAAATNNGTGVAGLGFPSELLIYKVMDNTGNGTDFSIAQAMMDAADNGARVISMSLAGAGYSQTLQDAANYAWQRNVVILAATGNNNSTALYYPGDANFITGIGASDSSDARASFSNYGFGVDVMAPGVSILSTYKGGGYATMSGTSMATPNAAAAAALLVASTPDIAADAVVLRLEESSDTPAAGGLWDPYIGYGRVNAYQALSGSLPTRTGGGLVGQVVDPNGASISGASVSLGSAAGTTDSNGLFRFADVPAGSYTFTASGGGYASRSQNVVVPAGGDVPLLFTLGIQAGTLTGTVTSGGQPVANAIVQAWSGGLVEQSAATSTSGVYTLVVPPGSHTLKASAVGRATGTSSPASVTSNGITTVDFDLPGLGVISGTVTDGAALVQGAQIVAYNTTDSGGGTTAADGTYSTLGLPAGTYTVEVTATGHQAVTYPDITVTDGGNTVLNVQLTSTGVATQVTLSPLYVGGGGYSSANTVTISAPAGPGGATVTLVSNKPNVAQVPATVTVPAGATVSSPFTIHTTTVQANTVVSISGTYGGVTKSANMTVVPYLVSGLYLSPSSVGGGSTSTTNRVQINTPAPAGGAQVALTSDNPAVTVPATVTIAEGTNLSSYFNISTTAVAATASVTITATYANSSKSATLTVNPTSVASFVVGPASIAGGKTFSSAIVKLDSPAPAGNAVVALASSDPAVQVPPNVVIAAGATQSANIPITTSIVSATTQVVLTATYGAGSKTATVTVLPPALYSFWAPSTIAAGKTITNAYLTITGPAPAGGAVVTVTSSDPAAQPPATVTVPAGSTSSGYFQIPTSIVPADTQTTLTATFGGVSKTVVVTITSTSINTLSIFPATIAGGKSITTASLTLTGPAGPSGAAVTMTSSDSSVVPPAVVNVPAGATSSGYFTITTSTVSTTKHVTITATYGSSSKSAALTVNPPGLYAFSASPAVITGGKPITTGLVTLDAPAGPAGAVIALTSTDPVLVPPSTVTVPAGALNTGYFTMTTNSVSANTPVTVTASYGGASKTVTITVKPPGLYAFTVNPTTITGGKPITYGRVILDGPAGPSGAALTIVSSNPSVATPPAVVNLPAGTTMSAYFAIDTSYVSVLTPVTFTTSYGGVTKSATVNVKPPALYGFTASPSTITGGKPISSARVVLDGPAGPGGAVVTISSSDPAATPPATLVIAAGATDTGYFSIPTSSVTSNIAVTLTASYAGASKTAQVTVKPPALYAFSASPSTVSGGKPITFALATLDGPAGPAGVVVNLSSSSPAAVTPATVTVQPGATNSGYFSIATTAVAVATQVTITASAGGVTKTATVTVKPTDLYSLTVYPSTIKGGANLNLIAYLDGPAQPGGAQVSITSSDPAAPFPAIFTVPEGATSASTSVTTLPVASNTPVTITAHLGTVTKSVTVTLTP